MGQDTKLKLINATNCLNSFIYFCEGVFALMSQSSRLFFLPPQLLTAPLASLRHGGRATGASAARSLPKLQSSATSLSGLELDTAPTPWLVASGVGRSSLLRVATRGLGRLTRDLASVALDKEASLTSGRLTPRSSVVEEGAREAAAALGGAPPHRRRSAAASASSAASKKLSYLGDEAQSRILGTFGTCTRATREGVAAALQEKATSQEEGEEGGEGQGGAGQGSAAGRRRRELSKRLALLADEGRARGLRLLAAEADRGDLRAGAQLLKAEGYFKPGTAPLPHVWVAAKAAPSSSSSASSSSSGSASASSGAEGSGAPTSPQGRLADFMQRNNEQLLADARAIAWARPAGSSSGGGGAGKKERERLR